MLTSRYSQTSAALLVDSGCTSAALLVASAAQNIELMGPVSADTTAQDGDLCPIRLGCCNCPCR